jgi:hypothetical protein
LLVVVRTYDTGIPRKMSQSTSFSQRVCKKLGVQNGDELRTRPLLARSKNLFPGGCIAREDLLFEGYTGAIGNGSRARLIGALC